MIDYNYLVSVFDSLEIEYVKHSHNGGMQLETKTALCVFDANGKFIDAYPITLH